MAQLSTRRVILICTVAWLVLLIPLIAADQEQPPQEIDFDRARELHRRDMQGDALTADERAYLERARELHAQRHGRDDAGPGEAGRDAGITGDGAGERWITAPAQVSLEDSPLQLIEPTTLDGVAARAYLRKPAGDGPFPAIVTVHGGLHRFNDQKLRDGLISGPVRTRLLQAGYVVVAATFRSYDEDVQSREPILDTLAVIQAVKKLPYVDPHRVAVFGGSGGGNIALELASLTPLQAAILGEPATVIYTGMLTTSEYGPRLKMMANPAAYFTPELKARTDAKLRTVACPLLILHGDVHALHALNHDLLLPRMRAAGLDVTWRLFPGQHHGFYFGHRADPATIDGVVKAVRTMLEPPTPE